MYHRQAPEGSPPELTIIEGGLTLPADQPRDDFHVYELGYVQDPHTGEAVLGDVSGKDFDPTTYSLFKYSHGPAARHYGDLLAQAALDYYADDPELLTETWIGASATRHVPSAAVHAMRHMSSALALRGFPPQGVFRVDRSVVRAVDYATLDDDARLESNRNRGITVPVVSHDIQGKDVLLVDDLRASGMTEATVCEAIGKVGVRRLVVAHIAELAPDVAGDPGMESVINQQYVQGLEELKPIFGTPDYALNARTCKFILRAMAAEVEDFAYTIPLQSSADIIGAMVADGYHDMDEYRQNYRTFTAAVAAKQEATYS